MLAHTGIDMQHCTAQAVKMAPLLQTHMATNKDLSSLNVDIVKIQRFSTDDQSPGFEATLQLCPTKTTHNPRRPDGQLLTAVDLGLTTSVTSLGNNLTRQIVTGKICCFFPQSRD